jgi:hypothetical protein
MMVPISRCMRRVSERRTRFADMRTMFIVSSGYTDLAIDAKLSGVPRYLATFRTIAAVSN